MESMQVYTQHSLLDKETTIALVRKAHAGDANAMNRLMTHNMKLVVHRALKAKMYLTNDLEDLIQCGIFGLHRAIEKYDPDKINPETQEAYSFSTYATWWIKQTIDRETAMTNQGIRLPIHALKEYNTFKRAVEPYAKLGIKLKFDELRAILPEMNDNQLKLYSHIPQLVTDTITMYNKDGEMDTSIYDITIDENSNVADIVEAEDVNEILMSKLGVLTDKQRAVIEMRFGLNGKEILTLEETGVVLNITRERVRQIQVESLKRLKQELKRDGFGEELLCP
jgi:RNA polymerase nonessential primary-like sigma factor